MPNILENPKAFFAKVTAMILFVLCLFLPAKNDAVTLKITNETITSKTEVINVQITNETRRKIDVSSSSPSNGKLKLQVKIAGEWRNVLMKNNTGDTYVEDGTVYYPGETFEESFSVKNCAVPVLVPGDYRLAFDYEVESDFNGTETVPATAYVEFTVAE